MSELQERLIEMRKIWYASTPVRRWYIHDHDNENGIAGTLRGPYSRWFKLTEPTKGHEKDVGKDLEYADMALNMMPRLIEAVEYLYKTVNNLEEILEVEDDEELKLEVNEWREEIERILKGGE